MIQENAMHGLSEVVESSESETEVGETSTDMAAFALLSEDLGGLDEVDGVVVVLRHSCGDGQNVDIEDNVLRWEVDLLGQYLEGSLADSDLV